MKTINIAIMPSEALINSVPGDKLLYEYENEEAFKEKFPEIFV